MRYITHFTFRPEVRNEAIRRFQDTGALPKDGVKLLGRWHAVSGNEGWALSESDDAKAQTEWILQWSDLLDFTITPVVDDQEFTEVLSRAR